MGKIKMEMQRHMSPPSVCWGEREKSQLSARCCLFSGSWREGGRCGRRVGCVDTCVLSGIDVEIMLVLCVCVAEWKHHKVKGEFTETSLDKK